MNIHHFTSPSNPQHKFIIGDSWLARFRDWSCITMRGKWRENRKTAREASLLLSVPFFWYAGFSCKIFLLIYQASYYQMQIKSYSSYTSTFLSGRSNWNCGSRFMLYYSCAHNLREKAVVPFLLHQLCAEAASSGQGEDMEFTPACGVPRWLWNEAPPQLPKETQLGRWPGSIRAARN